MLLQLEDWEIKLQGLCVILELIKKAIFILQLKNKTILQKVNMWVHQKLEDKKLLLIIKLFYKEKNVVHYLNQEPL